MSSDVPDARCVHDCSDVVHVGSARVFSCSALKLQLLGRMSVIQLQMEVTWHGVWGLRADGGGTEGEVRASADGVSDLHGDGGEEPSGATLLTSSC